MLYLIRQLIPFTLRPGVTMQTPEAIRLGIIERLLTKKRRRFRRVYEIWSRVNRERMDLSREIELLVAEKESLTQGQLILPGTPIRPGPRVK